MSADPNVEVVSPLARLDAAVRRHGCRLGVLLEPARIAPTHLAGTTPRQRVAALEVRGGGGGFWAGRELHAEVYAGKGDLRLQEAAAEILASLGRQGWLDADPEGR